MGRQSTRALWVAAVVVALIGFTAGPAAAAPPATGTVVEGGSVPGIRLGASRTQAQAAWGAPSFCQSGSHAGDQALCTWQRPDGSVDLSFRSKGGGDPKGRGNDVVAGADWTGLPGWVTTAGVSAPQALDDPESVPPAYPDAQVFRFGDGHLLEVIDPHLGIEVLWSPIPYTSQFAVTMFIFRPRS